jgi:hypothetical protein
MYVHLRVYVCMYVVCVFVSVALCHLHGMYVYVCVCMFVVCLCVYVRMYVCMYVCMLMCPCGTQSPIGTDLLHESMDSYMYVCMYV